jgi:hypothetical protein
VTISISCLSEREPVPRSILVSFECAEDHGLFGPARRTYSHADGFIAAYAHAMRDGWKAALDPAGVRIFLCPECSGKAIHAPSED